MRHLLLRSATLVVAASCASIAWAQQSSNPMGMDLGMLHSFASSPLPTQITTYEPPADAPLSLLAKSRHAHRLVRGPRYTRAHRAAVHMATSAN